MIILHMWSKFSRTVEPCGVMPPGLEDDGAREIIFMYGLYQGYIIREGSVPNPGRFPVTAFVSSSNHNMEQSHVLIVTV